MVKPKFSLAIKDERLTNLLSKTDHKILGIWAADCAEHILFYFEKAYPEDLRPRNAIKTLRIWINTCEFKMATIRQASLASHAAAREVEDDNAARSAARAAGQAVATAHVKTHSLGAANYALQAVFRATRSDTALNEEREWQYQCLSSLAEETTNS